MCRTVNIHDEQTVRKFFTAYRARSFLAEFDNRLLAKLHYISSPPTCIIVTLNGRSRINLFSRRAYRSYNEKNFQIL